MNNKFARPRGGSVDWVRLTRHEVENDLLPPVCMACGAPAATARVNVTFSGTPPWVRFLYYLGVLPGLIARELTKTQMRVSCPVCKDHRHRIPASTGVRDFGWLIPVLLGVAAFWAAYLTPKYVERVHFGDPLSMGLAVGFLVLVLGTASWVFALLREGQRKVRATKVTEAEVSLERVAGPFVQALLSQRQARDRARAGAPGPAGTADAPTSQAPGSPGT
jgi:hypothetical protein